MALLANDQVTRIWSAGECGRFALYSVKMATTADTIDLAAEFRNILQNTWLGATVSGVASGTATGTIITVPAGLTNAGAYVLVQGVAR